MITQQTETKHKPGQACVERLVRLKGGGMTRIKDVRFAGWLLLAFLITIVLLSAKDILAQSPLPEPYTNSRVKCERISDTYETHNPNLTGITNVWIKANYGTLKNVEIIGGGTVIMLGTKQAILSPTDTTLSTLRYKPTVKVRNCATQPFHPWVEVTQMEDGNGNTI